MYKNILWICATIDLSTRWWEGDRAADLVVIDPSMFLYFP